ncbi:hypothetical protein XANCAGTX0491_009789 [Xanthoria calcicola]
MTGNGVPPALVRSPEDLDEFYLEDASPATERSLNPMSTSERFIHQALLKRFPSVKSVVHSHSRAVIPFGIGAVPFQPTNHLAGGFIGEEAPVFEIADHYTPNDTQNLVNNPRFGQALANTFLTPSHNTTTTPNDIPAGPDYNLVLQRGHGFTTTATSIPQAVYRAVYTTWNAEVQASALTITDAKGAGPEPRRPVYRATGTCGHGRPRRCSYGRDWMLWAAQVGVNPLYANDLGDAAIPEPMTTVTER